MNQGANGADGAADDAADDAADSAAKGANTSLSGWERDSVSGSTTSGGTLKDSPVSSTGEQSDAAVAFGKLKITHGETSYVGSVHWEAVLNGVSVDLRCYMILGRPYC
jgi:hypothetical protein